MKRLIFYSALLSATAGWAYENTTLNITSCGGRMAGARYTSIGSLVSVGGSTTFSGSFCNHSGFAAGFILQPETAFGDLADEWNPDNERDGLLDGEETIAGSSLYKSDTDEDGLSDFDEVKIHGSHPALADTDADGMSDPNELIAGTSLTDASSLLTIACDLQPDGERILSWQGVSDRLYTFEYTHSLIEGWESYPFEIPGSDEPISFWDDATLPARFYRVQVRRP